MIIIFRSSKINLLLIATCSTITYYFIRITVIALGKYNSDELNPSARQYRTRRLLIVREYMSNYKKKIETEATYYSTYYRTIERILEKKITKFRPLVVKRCLESI